MQIGISLGTTGCWSTLARFTMLPGLVGEGLGFRELYLNCHVSRCVPSSSRTSSECSSPGKES